MAGEHDRTRELLEQMVADLYGKADQSGGADAKQSSGSYLIADDQQFLGKITTNQFDQDSILNSYGPYGSRYSGTSIFNPYCPYGGPYGRFSAENPYTTSPPTLVIEGRKVGKVSANSYVGDRIPVEAFLYSLKNDLQGLLSGRISRNEVQNYASQGETFIKAADGTFLGSLNPNKFDINSLFNQYGEYGNKYSSLSIFNKYSPYGGSYSAYSPYNPISRTPPQILNGANLVAYLTVNPNMSPRVDPTDILDWAQNNVRKHF